MKTFLSIVSVKTNNFSNEKLVVGLLAMSANKVFYAYSKNKIKLLSKVIKDVNIEGFVSSILKQIESTVKKTNTNFSKGQESLPFHNILISEEYISYLNNYNNGILQFSEPQAIPYNFSSADFSKYYKNFLGEPLQPEKIIKTVSFHKKLKPLLTKEGLDEKADINYNLNSNTFKGILTDVHVPLITKNGSINVLQEIDFSTQPTNIKNHLYETKVIFDALSTFSKTINCGVAKVKVAFEEPELKSEQHKLFDLAIKEYQSSFNFITPDEVDEFTDKVLENNFIKFSTLIPNT